MISKIKIGRKIVPKSTFHILTLSYHALCLSGLIWQVTQISINFFKFDVLTDINVIMPDELITMNRVTYICFPNHNIFDKYKYTLLFDIKYKSSWRYRLMEDQKFSEISKRFLSRNSTIAERFQVTPDSDKFFKSMFKTTTDHDEFLFGDDYCYQVKFCSVIGIDHEWRRNISTISLTRGEKIPIFDYKRLNKFDIELQSTVSFKISSYMYSIRKKKWPYTDDCADYSILGYANRESAIVSCIDEKLGGFKISALRIVTRNDTRYINYTIENSLNKSQEAGCRKIFKRLDCNDTVHMTHIPKPEIKKVTKGYTSIEITSMNDTQPSLTIHSKPRIDDIDFVTYIFGALGAWLGFSSMVINPIPFVFQTEETYDKQNTSEAIDKVLVLHGKQISTLKNAVFSIMKENTDFNAMFADLRKEMMETNAQTLEAINQIPMQCCCKQKE